MRSPPAAADSEQTGKLLSYMRLPRHFLRRDPTIPKPPGGVNGEGTRFAMRLRSLRDSMRARRQAGRGVARGIVTC